MRRSSRNFALGLIESGASWIPYTISQLGAVKRQALRGQQTRLPRLFELEPELFRANRLFVTIDPIDDIESLLKFGTEDNLMIGTDYSHTDISANLSALDEVRSWAGRGQDQQRPSTARFWRATRRRSTDSRIKMPCALGSPGDLFYIAGHFPHRISRR